MAQNRIADVYDDPLISSPVMPLALKKNAACQKCPKGIKIGEIAIRVKGNARTVHIKNQWGAGLIELYPLTL